MAGGPSGAGGRSAWVRPSAFPGEATKRAQLATLRSWGASPPILLRFVVARRPRAWSVCCPCALARVRPPVRAPAGAGGGGRGGARRAGSAAPPPGRRGPFRGEGGRPFGLGRGGMPAPPWPAGRRGQWGGEGSAGRAMVPHPPGSAEWPVAPSPVPLLLQRTPPGYIRSTGVGGQPRVPGAAWSAVGGAAWRGGGGGCQRAVPPGARQGGSAGWGAGRSLCRGLYPRLPRASTKARRSVCAPPSILHSWMSPFCCSPQGAFERWRRAAGRQRALRGWVGGRLGALSPRPR